MKVILLEDIKGVGKKGELIKASEGYARNFLLPRKKGIEATKGNLNEYEAKKSSEERKKQTEYEEAKNLAENLEGKKLKIAVKTGENGKLFGSVTNKEIASAIEEQIGLKIDKKKIVLEEAVKNVGEKIVLVKIHPKVVAKLKVLIIEA